MNDWLDRIRVRVRIGVLRRRRWRRRWRCRPRALARLLPPQFECMWSHNSNDTCLHSDDEVKKSSLLHCGCGELLRNRLRIYIRSSAGVKLACTAGFSFTLKPVRCERIYKSYKVRIKRKKRTFIMIIMLMERQRNSCLIGFSASLAPVIISATHLCS